VALNKKILIDGMRDFQANPPKNLDSAAEKWAELLYDYSKSAVALSVPVRFYGQKERLEKNIKKSMEKQVFLDDLGESLYVLWSNASWVSSAFTGITSFAPPSALKVSLKAAQALIAGGADGPAKLADAIDAWTRSVLVVLTNTSSGATSTAPLM